MIIYGLFLIENQKSVSHEITDYIHELLNLEFNILGQLKRNN